MKEIWNREDIITEVTKRLNFPKHKIETVFDFLFKFIIKISLKKSIVSITFPHLGRLYIKNSQVKKVVSLLEAKEKKGKLTRAEAIKLARFRSKQEELLTNSLPGTSKLKNHFTKPKIKNRYLTTGLTEEQLEEFQNES